VATTHLKQTPRARPLIYQGPRLDARRFWAHLPLIHGSGRDQKLSKRHGAQAVSEFADMGYLPEAMRNYLAKLGWGPWR